MLLQLMFGSMRCATDKAARCDSLGLLRTEETHGRPRSASPCEAAGGRKEGRKVKGFDPADVPHGCGLLRGASVGPSRRVFCQQSVPGRAQEEPRGEGESDDGKEGRGERDRERERDWGWGLSPRPPRGGAAWILQPRMRARGRAAAAQKKRRPASKRSVQRGVGKE